MILPEAWLPDTYILVVTAAGALIALVVWLSLAIRRLPLSPPIVCMAIGAAVFALPQVTFKLSPMRFPELTERLAEFVVIVALMGAGLKIDRLFGFLNGILCGLTGLPGVVITV